MIQFNKVVVHNFGSYGHAELDLQNRGFCLVSGQNKCVQDNALSNGAGKSFLWSAICFALTGETIGGIKSNLKNINVAEDSCYVTLELTYQGDHIIVHRIVAPKADLKLTKNDIDISGKGIRESEKKLAELLPEVTKDLIASTIIIGQGMPNRFSSFSPSGRKELLEKLTKSDFMIEDIKTRVTARLSGLNTKIRELEDSLIANKTQLGLHQNNLTKLRASAEQTNKPDFDAMLERLNTQITELQQKIVINTEQLQQLEQQLEGLNSQLLVLTQQKAQVNSEELKLYNEKYTQLKTEKMRIDFQIAEITKEIKKLEAITDTCPTCGQHLPNVHKPDTTALRSQLQQLDGQVVDINAQMQQCNQQHVRYQQEINSAFDADMSALNTAIANCKTTTAAIKQELTTYKMQLDYKSTEHTKLSYDKQNWEARCTHILNEIRACETEIASLDNIVRIAEAAKSEYLEHLAVVKKMEVLIRRDFRGYLLTNIITYLDAQAKRYCEIVFGTKELNLYLDGNALDISYCGKMFDGLSGGEKQRVDLILQLAIRDLLSSYLNLSANILVLDEITDFLDKKSCQAVMTLLEKELQSVESVFIVSHHAEELDLPIDSELKIIKNELGISEVV